MKCAAFGVLLAVAVAVASPASARQAIVPLYVERGPHGIPRLGIDVALGARTARLMVSTNTTGVLVLARAVAGAPAQRTSTSVSFVFDGGMLLRGDEARARLRFRGADGTDATTVGLVDGVECYPTHPDCPAANGKTPEMFGGLFSGVFGLGLIDPPVIECCRNPFNSSGWYHERYVVHSALAAPSLILDPDDATRKRFTMVPILSAETPLGCIRLAGGATNEVCGEVSFDTTTLDLTVTTNGRITPTPLPTRTTATLTVGGWSHTYAMGVRSGPRLVMRRGAWNSIVVGLAALQSIDLLYDLPAGAIGLRALDRGVAPAAKRAAPFPPLLGRWRCKSDQVPSATVGFAFAADGTGTRTVRTQPRAPAMSEPFTYMSLDKESFAMQTSGGVWTEMDLKFHGDALELREGGYWHESQWTAYPEADSYACRRAASLPGRR
ncbi:MAG: hypothetical protein JO036_04960 [Candidatus Eremiobacteraeota bacterium]|nr:hypothetical protein [Candidatus Eremiobacteraeota bacterium]